MTEKIIAFEQQQEEVDPSFLLRLRQLGDSGLRQAMHILSKDE